MVDECLTGWELLKTLAGREVKVVHGAGLLGVITADTEELYVLYQETCEGCMACEKDPGN